MVSSQGSGSGRRTRVTVVAPDVVGTRMAGPGLRYVAIARELARECDVVLAVGIEGSDAAGFAHDDVRVQGYSSRDELEALVLASDVVFCQFFDTNVADLAVRSGVRLVYDLYNALPVETVGAERISGYTTQPEKDREFAELISYFISALRHGSYFVASNERQRDYWLGYLMASGGLTPGTLAGRGIEELIGLAPFGMENDEPARTGPGLRGTHGITDDDVVLLWAGGIWDWFDAETPIRAVAALEDLVPPVKLVFYGTVHPNAAVGRPANVQRATDLARELGVLDRRVIFLDEWVPAGERANYLLDADLAVSAHRPSLETRYAFRTRILDHFWARLPSIVTDGDAFAGYIRDRELGVVVPCEDVPAMTAAIREFAQSTVRRDAVRSAIEGIREDWRWRSVLAQLANRVSGGLADAPEPVAAVGGAAAPGPTAPVHDPRSPLRRTLSAGVLGAAYRRLRRR